MQTVVCEFIGNVFLCSLFAVVDHNDLVITQCWKRLIPRLSKGNEQPHARTGGYKQSITKIEDRLTLNLGNRPMQIKSRTVVQLILAQELNTDFIFQKVWIT